MIACDCAIIFRSRRSTGVRPQMTNKNGFAVDVATVVRLYQRRLVHAFCHGPHSPGSRMNGCTLCMAVSILPKGRRMPTERRCANKSDRCAGHSSDARRLLDLCQVSDRMSTVRSFDRNRPLSDNSFASGTGRRLYAGDVLLRIWKSCRNFRCGYGHPPKFSRYLSVLF